MEMTEEKTGKRIWLVNQYAMPPRLESRLRTIKFAHYLQKAGYEVTIFASSIMHNMDIDLIEDPPPAAGFFEISKVVSPAFSARSTAC